MFILASASQARKRLIEKLSIDHRVMVSNIDEDKFEDPSVKGLVEKLASAKAEFVASKLFSNDFDLKFNNEDCVILGCDSLFDFNGEVFGKPKSFQDAIERWKMMSGNSGFIHTGHCLIYKINQEFSTNGSVLKRVLKDVVSTKINFSKLSNTEITNYVYSKEPMSCAGGFALEGKGSLFIESIEGCYSNVIGISLPWLRSALGKTLIPLFK